MVGVGLRRGGGLRRCARRQVEPAFAPAAPERKHGRAEQDDGPSPIAGGSCDSRQNPQCGGTIQRLACSGEPGGARNWRKSYAQPNFRSFSSRLSQAWLAPHVFRRGPAITGAAFHRGFHRKHGQNLAVIFGSIACMSLRGADAEPRPASRPSASHTTVTGDRRGTASKQGVALHLLPLKDMQAIEPKITAQVLASIPVEASVKSRASYGGTALKNVRAQAKGWLKRLEKERKSG